MKKTQADNFFECLKNNPKSIIEWCDREIAEYQKLKKLIEEELNFIKNNK